jgi:uncharacterized protein (DUF58 family)
MKVGLVAFTDEVEVELPSKKGLTQVWKILESLWAVRPRSQRTNLLRALEYLDTRLQNASLLFCISDFIAQEVALKSHTLQRLTRRHDFIPVILDDELETAFPRARGYLRLRDAEPGGELLFRLSDQTREKYESLLRERKIALQRSLYRLNLDHLFLRTGGPFLDAIIGFFFTRRRSR